GAADAIIVGGGKPGVDLARGARLTEAKTLHLVHAGGAQEQVLLGGLDALGRYAHAETAAEADHGVNDSRGIRRFLDRAHEARVDLELVERETPQIEQTRITGAEIVEREAYADGLEAQHRQLRGFEVAEQRAFGEFEFEPVGREVGLGKDALDHFDEVGAAELQRRDVDGDGEAGPGAAVEARALEHPLAKLDDQAGMLGNRNEL